MSQTTSLPELLAPAGSRDSLLAAVSAGADAVYLGGKQFSARQSAPNFDLEQIREVTDLLHLHHRKVYVTVNTLIADHELESALKYLTDLYNTGVDAIIIQDLGLIHLARTHLPQLTLHASTQMTVTNLDGVHFLQKLGIKRVVLARELTREEVATITRGAAAAGVEIEVFVHGALCISYSGQCLMSSMIGGRSGNRGRCAQPCRLPYRLIRDGEEIPAPGPHLLSPKDQALIPMIPELHATGVRSLKIEGRMKKPEYVYHVVRTYRHALDRYRENPEQYQVLPEELRDLEESFNRGFTTGYFGGNRNFDLMSYTRPNNRGAYLGRVSSYNSEKRRLTMKLEAELEVGDAIEVWVSHGGRTATPVRELHLEAERNRKPLITAPAGAFVSFRFDHGPAYPGDRVFKVYSVRAEAVIKEVLENPLPKIPCQAMAEGAIGLPLRLTFTDSEGFTGVALSKTLLQAAKNRPLTPEMLREHLDRLGNTPFALTGVDFRIDGACMLPFSELNEVRRQAVEALNAARLAPYRGTAVSPPPTITTTPAVPKEPATDRPTRISVWVADLPGVAAAAAAGADIIYAGGDELTDFHWTGQKLKEAFIIAHNGGARFVVALPRINREGQKNLWRNDWETVRKLKSDGIIVSDAGTLRMALAESDLPLYLNYTMNLFNTSTLRLLAEITGPRLVQAGLSPELTLEQVFLIKEKLGAAIKLECLVQGPLELMITEYCAPGSLLGCNAFSAKERGNETPCRPGQFMLRDRINADFPIYMDQYHRMHVLNCVDYCLYADLSRFTTRPGLVLRLDLKTQPSNIIARFVTAYREMLNRLSAGYAADSTTSEETLATFQTLTGRAITRGHYFRGVE